MYDSENTISDCLKSIINIDYSPLEVIVVNDGSTDNSVEVTKSFMEKNERPGIDFTLLGDESNRGISIAKNRGMKHMNGAYFFFAGADDLQFPNRVSNLLPIWKRIRRSAWFIPIASYGMRRRATKFSKRGFPIGMTNENSFLYQLKKLFMERHFVRSPIPLGIR